MVGSGGIARRRTIPEGLLAAANAKLVAVYGPDPAANAKVARDFQARAVGSVAELLREEIDAVYVASPPALHLEQVTACARARKHVLCEKPLGLTVAEATAMVAVCEQAKVCLGTAFMMRFHAQHQAALKLIQEGRLGKLVFGRAQLSCWYPPIAGAWRHDPAQSGGGALMDMGGHCIDLLEMFLGPAETVCCLLNRTVHAYEAEDSAVVSLAFANGALGVVDTFFCVPDPASKNALELYGAAGSILATNTIGQGDRGEMTAHLQMSPANYDPHQTRPGAQTWPLKPAPVNTYRAEMEEFSQAILEGREPRNNGQLGLRSQRVLAACYESARTRKHAAVGAE